MAETTLLDVDWREIFHPRPVGELVNPCVHVYVPDPERLRLDALFERLKEHAHDE